MNQLKKKPWFVFLLVLFFVLHGTVENFGNINHVEIIKVGSFIIVIVSIFYFMIKRIVKNIFHAALICFFISVWILFFGAIFDWVRGIGFLSFLHSYSIFVPFMFCAIIGFIIFIRKKNALSEKVSYFLNVLLLLYCLYDLFSLLILSSKEKKQFSTSTISFDTTLVKAKPNVYFMIFDTYPGYKSLKDSFGYANDDMYNFLEEKDFKILPTFSNYNITFFSMASTLNMQYIDKPFLPLHVTFETDQDRIKELKNAQVVQNFKSMGYSFNNYSIFDILDKPSVKGNSFLATQATLLTHKIFFNRMIKDIGWNFVTGKYKIPFVENMYMVEKINNRFIEKKLLQPNVDKKVPQFTYAHFTMPHAPFFYDSTGKARPNDKIFDKSLNGDKSIFLSYLKYVNTKIKNLVGAISKNDSNAIIIVMSDHGWSFYKTKEANTPFFFNNICAVHFPDKNYLPMKEQWSNVNFFRYLFNCEFNQKIPYLKDSSTFLVDTQK
jgi:hypothetical protein